jgi:hypothetical protein
VRKQQQRVLASHLLLESHLHLQQHQRSIWRDQPRMRMEFPKPAFNNVIRRMWVMSVSISVIVSIPPTPLQGQIHARPF